MKKKDILELKEGWQRITAPFPVFVGAMWMQIKIS